MPAGGELLQVEALDVHDVDAGDIPEGLDDLCSLCAVNEQRALAVHVPAVPHLALAASDSAAVLGLLRIGESPHLLQNLDGGGSLLDALGRIGDHERDFRDALYAVPAGHHERGYRGGRQRGHDGVAA